MTLRLHAQFVQPGLKAGLNISNFTGGNFRNFDHKSMTRYHAGGFLRFNFGSMAAIQPELLFSAQGAKLDSGNGEAAYKINYFTIPIMFQYHTEGGVYFEAGPQFGFKLSENIPDDARIDNFAKGGSTSLGVGLGWGKKGLGVGARYLFGLSNVGDFENAYFDPDFKQGVFQLSLFYIFFSKKKD